MSASVNWTFPRGSSESRPYGNGQMTDNDKRRIALIVGISVGIVIAMGLVFMLVRCITRAQDAADLKARFGQIAEASEEETRRRFVIDGVDMEYGYGSDARAEAEVTAYRGGMADVAYFQGGRATQFEREHQARGATFRGIIPSPPAAVPCPRQEEHRSTTSPPRPELSYLPNRNGYSALPGASYTNQPFGATHPSSSELARKIEDIPPAYSAVIFSR